MSDTFTETELALAHAKELLKVARCPNMWCFRGVIMDSDFDGSARPEQCQWCAEKEVICG